MRYLFVFFVAVGSAVWAQHSPTDSEGEWHAGQSKILTAGCQLEHDAIKLMDAVAETGDRGYNEVMNDSATSCFDVRIHNFFRQFPVLLVEPIHEIIHGETGDKFKLWLVHDPLGRPGYTWEQYEAAEGIDA